MNTEKLWAEFEKIFGQYKSKRIKRCQRILSPSKTMIWSPYLNFLYEVSLSLKIGVSGLKMLFGNDCKYLYSLCDNVYKRFRRFRKNCKRIGVATYRKSGENLEKIYASVFRGTGMLDQILQKLFMESRMTLELLFYETVVLTFEFSICRQNEKR